MADISKIKTLDGTTYNIKDASARSSIPAAATIAPKMDGTAAIGSSAKYAKEDHVHPSDNTKLNYDAALFTTNSFAPSETRSLYISQINNAFFALDKRYSVSVVYDGDPVSNVAQFFDGSYEGNNLRIQPGKSAVFTLDFSNGSGSKFAGYPYGYIYITFYASNIPASITGRVYNNYASQTVGWKTLTFEQFGTSMFRARQDYYGLQTLEITMVGSGDTPYGYTSPVEIEFHATRPDPVEHSSIITKYGAQKLYYSLTAPSFIGSLTGNASSATKATQDESGNNIKASYAASISISDHTITLKNKNGTSLGTVTVPDSSGTSDYTDLSNKPSINNVTLIGNKTAAELGLGTYSKPSGGIPASDLASAVQTSLGKADSALQSVPSTYRTAAAQDAIDIGMAKADEVGIVITGNRPSTTATPGQYVIVRNSTISGISDGLYIASTSLSPSTDVTAVDLHATGAGGLNSLLSRLYYPVWSDMALLYFSTMQALVDAISPIPTFGFMMAVFTGDLKTDLFNSPPSYGGIIIIYKASANNAYYLAFSREAAAVGNISITDVSVTMKSGLVSEQRSVTYTYTINARSRITTNLYNLINADMPTGAVFESITGFQSGDENTIISAAFYSNSDYSLCINNISSSKVTSKTATIYYRCH